MTRVVMLTYYFPPLAGIASERAAAAARHLSELGWNPVVIAPRSGMYHRGGAGDPPGVRVVRTANPELSRLFRAAAGRARTGVRPEEAEVLREVESGTLGSALRRRVREFVYVPDARVGWIPFAAAAARREIAAGPPDEETVIFSSSVPFSAHLAAMWTSRRSGAPWVAEFRDPWSTAAPELRPESRIRRWIDRRIEGAILRRADGVTLTSASTRERVLEAFPDVDPEKVRIVMNGFEPGEEHDPPGPRDAFTLLYAGTVARGVDVGPVVRAVGALAREEPGSVRLRVLGPPAPWRDAAGDAPDASSWLETPGMVSPAEARAGMRRASALLLVISGGAYRAILPGKLFEYVGARRPVVAVVPEESEMERILRAHGDARIVRPYDERVALGVLRRLLEEHRGGTIQEAAVTSERVAPLSRSTQIRKLAEFLESAGAAAR